jgi:hypothetical protein
MMTDITGNDLNTGRKKPGMRKPIAVALIATFLLIGMVLYFSKYMTYDTRYKPFLLQTAEVLELTSRLRINLLKSTDLEKGAVMAITDDESKAFAEQSRISADAVESDYHVLKDLIDAGGIDKEERLLQEFGESWKDFRDIDRDLLSLAVENTNIKAANLSYSSAAQAIWNFKQSLSKLMDIPSSDVEKMKVARLIYEALSAAFMIYSLQAPHINEAQDKKMDELEIVMGTSEQKVRTYINSIIHLTGQQRRAVGDDASLAFAKFIEVNKEVVRLSRMNTNVKSLQLSLGRKRKVATQCEEILNSLQGMVQGRAFKATR